MDGRPVLALFDSDLVVRRKLRAIAEGDEGAWFLMRRAAEDLFDRLSVVGRTFDRAAAIHCLTGDAAEAVRASGKAAEIVRVEQHTGLLAGGQGLVSDGEALPLAAESLDLAVSLLTLHEANDLPGLLVQIRRALRPDGLFLACMAGAGTLAELRESLLEAETELSGGASPRIIPFADVRDAGALLQRAGFALPVADIEQVTVRYATMFHLMRDLRAMGATNALAGRLRRPTPRTLFARAAQIYAERFADGDGRVRATFNLIWVSGWAPAPGQQKDLKPGSAKVSLAEVLGDSSGASSAPD